MLILQGGTNTTVESFCHGPLQTPCMLAHRLERAAEISTFRRADLLKFSRRPSGRVSAPPLLGTCHCRLPPPLATAKPADPLDLSQAALNSSGGRGAPSVPLAAPPDWRVYPLSRPTCCPRQPASRRGSGAGLRNCGGSNGDAAHPRRRAQSGAAAAAAVVVGQGGAGGWRSGGRLGRWRVRRRGHRASPRLMSLTAHSTCSMQHPGRHWAQNPRASVLRPGWPPVCPARVRPQVHHATRRRG
jgi:hypothetical protein